MIQKLLPFYDKAIRTTLLAQEKGNKRWFNLFSVIEFQAKDEYPYVIPNEKWTGNCIRSQQSKMQDYTFYLAVDEIASPAEALAVYNNPVGDFNIDGNTISFFNTSFVQEPAGDYPLIFPSNLYANKGISDVLPRRKSGLMVWCQIDSERVVEKKIICPDFTKEMEALQKLTIEWLGFDIIQKKEHLGNIYLSAPNPYFREIDVSLSINPIGIFYKILRKSNNSEPLNFRIIDKHGDAIALDKVYPISESTGIIELPHEPHLFELRIYNSDNELIAVHEPATFLRSIHLGINMKQADFKVNTQTEKGEKEFTVEKFSKEVPIRIGNIKDFNPEYYFSDADAGRLHIELEEKKEFIFFPGAKSDAEKSFLKKKAKNCIREIINNAKDTCYICDPYFSGMDIVDFAFHIKNSGIKINIINSKQFISKEKAEIISNIIGEYNSKPFSNISVRTLRGDSILHDRFIITDKDVWFVGSSFNEFGNRATCIAKVPKSSGILVIKEVEKWFSSSVYSEDIDEYIKESTNE